MVTSYWGAQTLNMPTQTNFLLQSKLHKVRFLNASTTTLKHLLKAQANSFTSWCKQRGINCFTAKHRKKALWFAIQNKDWRSSARPHSFPVFCRFQVQNYSNHRNLEKSKKPARPEYMTPKLFVMARWELHGLTPPYLFVDGYTPNSAGFHTRTGDCDYRHRNRLPILGDPVQPSLASIPASTVMKNQFPILLSISNQDC